MLIENHQYKGIITGEIRRSVTTILAEEGWINKRWYKEGFTELGTEGHKLLHLYDKKIPLRAPPHILRYLEPYKRFLAETGAEVVDSEVEVENPLLGYAGQLDKIIKIKKKFYIMDIKFTSGGYVIWHDYQTEGYRQALIFHPHYGGLPISGRGGIILRPDCEVPKLTIHDRVRGIEQIWQSICISNAAKHRDRVELEKAEEEETKW